MFAAFGQMISGVAGGGSTVISGTAYPGNTLTSTGAAQWYVNDVAVSGETGSSYVIRLNDIGYAIRQTNSNSLTCWSPADISGVAAFWTPYRNNYNTVGPDVLATSGQTVRRWTDIKSGIQWNQTTDASKPSMTTNATGYPVLSFAGDRMDISDLTLLQNKSYGALIVSANITAHDDTGEIISFSTGASNTVKRLALFCSYVTLVGRMVTRATRLDNTSTNIAISASGVGSNKVFTALTDYASGVSYLRKDGVEDVTDTGMTTGSTANTASLAGTLGNNPADTADITGTIACVCVVNSSLTATELSQLERYEGLFWGKNIPLV